MINSALRDDSNSKEELTGDLAGIKYTISSAHAVGKTEIRLGVHPLEVQS